MNAIELRSEIIALLNKTEDVIMLEWLKSVLSDPQQSKEVVDDMILMAELSEVAIAKGEVFTRSEVEEHLRIERLKRENG